MKVLIISMLRPGDFVMHLSLIRGAQKKYPGAEIHVLVQDISRPFTGLLDSSVKVHEFARSQIIEISKNPAFALTAPIHILSNLLSRLKDESFDVVINLTHNTQSALIAGQLEVSESYGLMIKDNKVFGIETEFARKFNNEFVDSRTYPHHYVQALAQICQLESVSRNQNSNTLAVTEANTAQRKIGFQFLSSDTKKDISIALARHFVDAAKRLGFETAVMAATFEVPKLQSYFSNEEMQILKIHQLIEFISSCDIVVSVDTLQLQLASELNIPTLALHLGSANVVKTGSRSIMQEQLVSKASCYPCAHSSSCPYSEHRCEDFKVADFEAALLRLNQKINKRTTSQPISEREVSAANLNFPRTQNLESL